MRRLRLTWVIRWCDNWVSTVYGPSRTLRLAKQEVRHLLTGTRYDVYRTEPASHASVPKALLPAALNEGACKIDSFLDGIVFLGGTKHTRQTPTPVMSGRDDPRATVRCRP